MAIVQLHNFSQKMKSDLKKLNQWDAIQSIFRALDQKKRLCWISGGAVRDIFLSRKPLDIDLTTDATEDEILELFPQAVLVGQQFGVYKIPLGSEVYDLTVFREEDAYLDGRRPTAIRRSTPEKDAERRDFTVNALFWDLKNEVLIDSVGGVADLERKQIRCVGQPLKRFQEDFLRVLRMMRLAYQLGFKVEQESYRAGLTQAASLTQISGERILAEILKLSSQNERLLFWSDELVVAIFEHNQFIFKDLSDKIAHIKKTKEKFNTNELQVLTELLYLVGINLIQVQNIQQRLKISKDTKQWLTKCCEIQSFIQQKMDFAEYGLLVDRSIDYLQIIKYFTQLGLMSPSLLNQIESALNTSPEMLVTPQDIMSLVPPQMISKTLNQIRKLQFKNQIRDKQSALEFIQKNTLN